ncbi:MAG: hypothetical protein C0507_09480 [Cyanobacteria bacterium PR.3.49]|nr:hypothetical protein [Cyanobacteria bacterium PR.3.49]
MFDSPYASANVTQDSVIQISANESLFDNNLRSLPSDPLAQYRAPYIVAPGQFNSQPAQEIRLQPGQEILTPVNPALQTQSLPAEPLTAPTEQVADRLPQDTTDRAEQVQHTKNEKANEPPRFAIVAAELLVLAACIRLGFRKAPAPGTPTMADEAFKVVKSASDKIFARMGNTKVGSMFSGPSRETTVPTAKELAEGALGRKIVGPPEVHIRTPRDVDPMNRFRVAN